MPSEISGGFGIIFDFLSISQPETFALTFGERQKKFMNPNMEF